MTTEELEQIVATIDKGLKPVEKRSIGEASTVTISLVVILITFICGTFIYIDNIEQGMMNEIEKRFVQAQDVAGMKVQIEGMISTQMEMKSDIKLINDKLDGVRIKSK